MGSSRSRVRYSTAVATGASPSPWTRPAQSGHSPPVSGSTPAPGNRGRREPAPHRARCKPRARHGVWGRTSVHTTGSIRSRSRRAQALPSATNACQACSLSLPRNCSNRAGYPRPRRRASRTRWDPAFGCQGRGAISGFAAPVKPKSEAARGPLNSLAPRTARTDKAVSLFSQIHVIRVTRGFCFASRVVDPLALACLVGYDEKSAPKQARSCSLEKVGF
jgi:hypothetical protein